MITTPLEPALVKRLRGIDSRLQILWDPDLLPPPRYPSDHQGDDSFQRDGDGQRRWQAMLSDAEVLLGIPGDTPAGLTGAVKASTRLRWVQATAAGAGEQVAAAGLSFDDLRRVTITTMSGVHAGPLAEFALFGLLAFTKDLPQLRADKVAHHWDHRPVAQLHGQTLLIVGLGAIGTEVARLGKAFGMRTVGVNRSGHSDSTHLDDVRAVSELARSLGQADAVVITLPLTNETRGMIDAAAVTGIKPGAVLVNVGRGGVIDEPALTAALASGDLKGAALDVFTTEPLPPQSTLWALPNVIISSHTAGLAIDENERVIDLFTDNLRRYLAGDTLRNRVDPVLLY